MSITREYEITYIIDPALDENKRGELSSAVDSKIDELKGTISTNTDNIRRKLSYPINKQRGGFLRYVQMQLPTEQVAALRHEIQRLKGVLRLSIVQSAARAEVTTAIFDVLNKQPQAEPKKVAIAKKPAKEMSSEEVEEKIAEALDEEVK